MQDVSQQVPKSSWKGVTIVVAVIAILAVFVWLPESLRDTYQAGRYTQVASDSVRLYGLEEVNAMLDGKTEEEVYNILGKPDRTKPGPYPFSSSWYYTNPPILDEWAKKRYDRVTVYFSDGKFDSLYF